VRGQKHASNVIRMNTEKTWGKDDATDNARSLQCPVNHLKGEKKRGPGGRITRAKITNKPFPASGERVKKAKKEG